MKKIIFFLILILIISIPSFAKKDKKEVEKEPSYTIVEAEGSASINGDEARAEDEAVLAAQKRAIEEVVGCFVKSEAVAYNLTEYREKISKVSEGYITDCKIIKESKEIKDIDGYKILYLKIKAKVWTGKIYSDLSSMKDLYEKLDKPKFAVLINENNNVGANLTDELDSRIVNQLKDLNFIVIDKTMLNYKKYNDYNDYIKALKNLDIKILLNVSADTYVNTIGNKIKTDIVNINIPVNSAQCSLSISFVDLTTGISYYTDTIIGHTGMDLNAMGMAVSATKDAVNKFFAPKYLEIIQAQLCNKWIELYNNHILYVKIKNLKKYTDCNAFKEAYKAKDRFFVKYNGKNNFNKENTTFEIVTRNKLDTSIEYIDGLKFGNTTISVIDVKDNEIIAEAK